ncbi:MAG: hypothetical protein RLZZ396_1754 [Planctomycetota bacterium]|jgi:hypothetical protein
MVILQAARRVNKTSNQSHAPKVDDASDPAGALPPNPRDFLGIGSENHLFIVPKTIPMMAQGETMKGSVGTQPSLLFCAILDMRSTPESFRCGRYRQVWP